MKSLAILCLLSMVALSVAQPRVRGCMYYLESSSKECPEGTHAYALGCGQRIPEPTCDVPAPVKEEGTLCDYSSCYCDSPTVRDTATNKCVPLNECPKKE